MKQMRRIAAALAIAIAGWWATQAPADAASPNYPPGEPIVITGTVVSGDDRTLAGVEVALIGYRKSFDIWRLRRTRKGVYTIRTVTGADGRFEIGWRWDDFYNRFELQAGIATDIPEEAVGAASETSDAAETPKFLVLAEVDLSRRILQGSPVVTPLTIQDTALLESWQGFLATLQSLEQRRVYQEMGKPDKVQTSELSSHREVTWWYFERGKVYRFRNGEIESVEDFEPVLPGSS